MSWCSAPRLVIWLFGVVPFARGCGGWVAAAPSFARRVRGPSGPARRRRRFALRRGARKALPCSWLAPRWWRSAPVPGDRRSCCTLKERSPRGITAETGEPYLGHTLARIARCSYLFKRSRELFASHDMAHRRSLRAIPDGGGRRSRTRGSSIRLERPGFRGLLRDVAPRRGAAAQHDRRAVRQSHAEIAHALQLGVETVRTHAAHIRGKLGVRNKRELITCCVPRG